MLTSVAFIPCLQEVNLSMEVWLVERASRMSLYVSFGKERGRVKVEEVSRKQMQCGVGVL